MDAFLEPTLARRQAPTAKSAVNLALVIIHGHVHSLPACRMWLPSCEWRESLDPRIVCRSTIVELKVVRRHLDTFFRPFWCLLLFAPLTFPYVDKVTRVFSELSLRRFPVGVRSVFAPCPIHVQSVLVLALVLPVVCCG